MFAVSSRRTEAGIKYRQAMRLQEAGRERKASERLESLLAARRRQQEELQRQIEEAERYRQEMEERIRREEAPPVPIRRLMREICEEVLQEYPQFSLDDILSIRRNRDLVRARFACIWACHMERKDLSYPQMGKFFRRDHTSVLHAVQVEAKRRGKS